MQGNRPDLATVQKSVASYPAWGKALIAHSATALLILPVRASLYSSGSVSYAFSQCINPAHSCFGATAACGGICEALAVYWMKHHGSATSLWQNLFPNGPDGPLDEDFIAPIIALQLQHKTAAEQSQNSAIFLLTEAHLAFVTHKKSTSTTWSITDIATAITGSAPGQKCMIELTGRAGGHTMAASIEQDGSIVFFDPNFGEFTFPNAAHFAWWFTYAFWYTSTYFATLSETYKVSRFRH